MSSSRLSVAICGGGACGLAVLLCLLEELETSANIRYIYMYEKRSVIGPGLAYSSGCGEAIINMAAGTMGLFASDPLHFSRWVTCHRPDFDGVRYPPRRIYGEYLTSLFEFAKRDAASKGLHLEIIPREVVHLCKDDGKFALTDGQGQKLVVDKVVLAVGNFPACTQPHLRGHHRYRSSPWPLHNLDTIPPESSVCIVGTRLSGIDAVLHLAASGHKGPLYLVSRGGCLPGVQRLESKAYRYTYELELLARGLEDLSNPVPIQTLAQKLMALAEQLGVKDWAEFLRRKSPLEKLSQEIIDSEKGTDNWTLLAGSLAPLLERYWNCLTAKDQVAFMNDWLSAWFAHVHAMPYKNALRLQQLLRENKLKVLEFHEIQCNELEFTIECRDDRVPVDWVIEATGLELSVSRIQSPLLHSLLESKVFEEHPSGGLSIDQYTLQSVATKGIYVTGSLTTGVHFYTNGIDRNVIHASRISQHLVGKPVYPPAHLAIILPAGATHWADFISRAVPSLLRSNVVPFLYLCGKQYSTDVKSKSNEGCLEQLRTDPAKVLGGSECIPTASVDYQSSDLIFHDLCETHGISVQGFEGFDYVFLNMLKQHYIDVGLLVQNDADLGTLSSVFKLQKLSTNAGVYLLSKAQDAIRISRDESDHSFDSELSKRLRYYEENVTSIILDSLQDLKTS